MTSWRVPEYLDWLTLERRYSPNTLEASRSDLHRLVELLGEDPVDTLHIRSALAKLKTVGLSPRTIARMASTWRSYFRWEIEFHGRATHPMTGLKTPKQSKLLPKALSPDAALQLVSHTTQTQSTETPATETQASSIMHQQARVLADLLYGTGMRLSEALSLDCQSRPGALSWIDWSEKMVFVTGKGNKQRSIPLPGGVFEVCLAWREARNALVKTSETQAFFLGSRGDRLSPRMAQKSLGQWAVLQGLDQHVHPHMLRHSYASHVLQSSGDLRAVQELLGHASIASTQVYTALDFQHLAAVYDKAHPRAKTKT